MKLAKKDIFFFVMLIGAGFIARPVYGIDSGLPAGTSTPAIIITSPTNSVVTQPRIEIDGLYNGSIQTVTFDVSNSAGIEKDQEGEMTGEIFDQKNIDRVQRELSQYLPGNHDTNNGQLQNQLQALLFHPTNRFSLYWVGVAPGQNFITIHVKNTGGRQCTAKRTYVLDYRNKKPPQLTSIWPPDKTKISGDTFDFMAQLDDNTAGVRITVTDASGHVYATDAIIELSGKVWGNHLPLGPGTNEIIAIATDAAGNSSTNMISVSRSEVSVRMVPLKPDQMNKSRVDVTGTITDTNCFVEVNGVKGTTHPDGTWDAQNVPVSPTGTATFNMQIYRN